MTPKVSIVVPCWGVEKYLDKCVESLINQTLKDIEIILVDDESPDRVPQMCDDWAKKDSRIKVIHKKNGGLGFACNSGLEMAIGKYVAFCDSDDWVDLNMYEELYEEAEKENADAVYSGLRDVTMDGTLIRTRNRFDKKLVLKDDGINSATLDIIASAPGVKSERKYEASAKVVLYRRELLTDNNLLFVSERQIASEDLIFNFNVIANSKTLCFLPKAYYNYRVNLSSISRGVNIKKYDAIIEMYHHLLKECERIKVNGDYQTRCQRVFLGSVRVYACQILTSLMSKSEKREAMAMVLHNTTLNDVLRNYPIGTLPIPQRFFTHCLKHKFVVGLTIFAKLKH